MPAKMVDAWKAARGRTRGGGVKPAGSDNVLTSEELNLLLATAERRFPDFYALILFLADTGCRIPLFRQGEAAFRPVHATSPILSLGRTSIKPKSATELAR